MDKQKKLHVIRIDDKKIVHSVATTSDKYEKVMLGMLRHMDTSIYYIDDSEFDEVS